MGRKAATDGLELLREDHQRVKALLDRYEALGERGDKRVKERVAQQICAEVLLHAKLEESILYPIAREAIDADDELDEALVEHEAAEQLVKKLSDMDPDDEMYDATVKVLGEQLQHHIDEEEGELFPKISASGLDREALGAELEAKRQTLLDHADSTFGTIKLAVLELFSTGARPSA
jgi:hemerythrin superfamily protein